jgi:hypothetical protein
MKMATITTPAIATTAHPSIASSGDGALATAGGLGAAPGVPRMSWGASTAISATRPAASSGSSAGSSSAGATATLRRRRDERASDTALTFRDERSEHLVGERAVCNGGL